MLCIYLDKLQIVNVDKMKFNWQIGDIDLLNIIYLQNLEYA